MNSIAAADSEAKPWDTSEKLSEYNLHVTNTPCCYELFWFLRLASRSGNPAGF